MNKRLTNISVILVSCIFAVILGEGVLRLVVPHNFYMTWQPNLNYTHYNFLNLANISDTINVTSNSLGYRGNHFFDDGRYGIMAIGGSTTECTSLNDENTWTNLLEEKLNTTQNQSVTIGNFGKSGLNSGHHYLQLKHLEPQFDNIQMIIMLVGINDYLRFFSLGNNYYSTDHDPYLFRKSFARYPRWENSKWYQRTEWWMYLRNVKQNYFPPTFDKAKFKQQLNDNFINYQTAPKVDTLPNMKIALDNYKSNLTAIIDLAKEKNIKLIFLTQPVLWKEQMSERELRIANLVYNEYYKEAFTTNALAEGMEQFNDVLRQIAHQKDVNVIDLAKILSKDTTVFYDHCHFNNTGASQLANIIYPKIDSLINHSLN